MSNEAKPREPMPTGVKYAYAAMALVTVAANVLPVPVYVHMMVLALGAIYVGSVNSISQEAQESGEQLETKDAMMFPFIGSAVLFSLYLVFKFLPRDYVNLVVKAYFFVFGVLALGKRVSQVLGALLPEATASGLTQTTRSFMFPAIPEVPVINPAIEGETPEEAEAKRKVEFTNLDVVGLLMAAVVGVAYLLTNHWVCSNIFGVSFSIAGIEALGLGSYFNGLILLSGLFFYDIFWVFGTDVMVTVAKSFDAPIKLLFPQTGGEGKPSMLGLGDVVIPGIFIALMFRFDLAQQKENGTTNHVYFKWVLVAYWLGLSTTVWVMYAFKAAQPALLYLVPAVLGATMLLALSRGEFNTLVKFSEEKPKEEEETTKIKQEEEETSKTK